MSDYKKGVAYTILGGICWGISGIFGKYLFDAKDMDAPWLVTVRLLAAGMILLVLAFKAEGPHIFDVWKKKSTSVSLLIFSVFGAAGCQLTYFLTVQYSNPGTATVIEYISPVIVMLFYAFAERRRPGKLEAAVLIIVMAGIFLMSTHGSISGLVITTRALIWGLLSAVTMAIYNIQPRKLLERFGTMTIVGWGMLTGGILITPFTRVWEFHGKWDAVTLLMLIGAVFIGTVMAYECYMHGIMLIGPVQGSMFACVEPLVATILSAAILGETFGVLDIFGMACIMAGVTALAVFSSHKSQGNMDYD